MTDELVFERLAAHAGPADVDPGFGDRLYSHLLQERSRSRRFARPALLLVAALLAALAIAGAVAIGSGLLKLPRLDKSPAPSASLQAAASQLPPLRLPGTRAAPAGEYGWTGQLGSTGGMHRVIGGGRDIRQTQLMFRVLDDCFGAQGDPVPLRVAGLDGLYLEPYEPPVTFIRPRGGERTGAYALPIAGRTLCVYLTWDPATTPAELEGARQTVESIRGQPWGTRSIRITFTLQAGWDTG